MNMRLVGERRREWATHMHRARGEGSRVGYTHAQGQGRELHWGPLV